VAEKEEIARIEAIAAAAGVPVAPEHRDGVAANFARIAALAALVLEHPLPDEIEIAPIFVP
jgi:hypothetical protein